MEIRKRFNYTSSEAIFPQVIKDLDPFQLFEKCFSLASQKVGRSVGRSVGESVSEPNQMILSTVSADGIPSSRVVLLKEFNKQGFYFYTHYTSQKGREIEKNPQVAINFYWDEIKIQIRINGKAQKVSPAKSKKYFASRPWLSQLGARLSEQSLKLDNYKDFVLSFTEAKQKYLGNQSKPSQIAKPTNWGGYVVIPWRFEFWRGRENRLHQRINCLKKRKWHCHYLSP